MRVCMHVCKHALSEDETTEIIDYMYLHRCKVDFFFISFIYMYLWIFCFFNIHVHAALGLEHVCSHML
jgi:hypothetical protein